MFKLHGNWFGQDDGGGAATGQTTDNSTGASGSAQTQTDQNAGKGDDKQHGTGEKTFTQSDVDQIVKDRLAREKKKAEEEGDKARKKAEEESLAKNQEFEKLANTRQAQIDELTKQLQDAMPFKEQAEKYKAAMDGLIQTQTDKLPASIKELLAKLDPIEKLEYLAKHSKELNVDVKGVPETDTGDPAEKLQQADLDKARTQNARFVKTLFGN